jgi:phage tail sheath protein FI
VVGEWSSPLVVRTAETARWFLGETRDSAAALLDVQLALLRMCAARGDLLAVLALPEHYREHAAVAHVRTLKGRPAGQPDPIFGYGALYHPWLYATDPARPAEVRRMPPDGAATGVLAARAFARGAWIAPANEPLPDVVELDPPLAPAAYQALQDAQLNVVRHEPGGFLWLAADTLSDTEDVRPIGVRRLLQVIRRAALLYGPDYAFEPNDDVLRRTIQRRFERLLSFMFSLGAFAGRTADESFRVNTGSPPNTPQSVDAGRLVVELQVAPSRPLTFLTVRLVRTGAGRLQVEAR